MTEMRRLTLARSARAAERSLTILRDRVGRSMDRIQFRLRVFEAQADPTARQWESRMRAAVANGTIAKQLAEQPKPEEVVDRWRLAKSS